MTDKKALEVLKSWLSVAYQNADGTDESSAELHEALDTVSHIINHQHEQTEKLLEVIFKKEDIMQMIVKEHQDELQNAEIEVAMEIFDAIKEKLIFNSYGIATISDKTFYDLRKKYIKKYIGE